MNSSQITFQTFGKGMKERPCFEVLNDLKYHLTPDNVWYFWTREAIKYPLSLLTVPWVIPFAFTVHVTALPATEMRGKLSREGRLALCEARQTETQDYSYLQFSLWSTVTGCCTIKTDTNGYTKPVWYLWPQGNLKVYRLLFLGTLCMWENNFYFYNQTQHLVVILPFFCRFFL